MIVNNTHNQNNKKEHYFNFGWLLCCHWSFLQTQVSYTTGSKTSRHHHESILWSNKCIAGVEESEKPTSNASHRTNSTTTWARIQTRNWRATQARRFPRVQQVIRQELTERPAACRPSSKGAIWRAVCWRCRAHSDDCRISTEAGYYSPQKQIEIVPSPIIKDPKYTAEPESIADQIKARRAVTEGTTINSRQATSTKIATTADKSIAERKCPLKTREKNWESISSARFWHRPATSYSSIDNYCVI